MRGFPWFAVPAALVVWPGAAPAAWMHCSVTGMKSGAPFAAQSIVADVGPADAPRLASFSARLADYVRQQDSTATGLHAECFASADSEPATTQYTLALQASVRKYGWAHVLVVTPEAWLTSQEIVDSAAHP